MSLKTPALLLSLVGMSLAVGCLNMTALAQKVPVSSLTDSDEVKKLREKVLRLQENLLMAKADADLFREKLVELKLKNKALGLEALTGDEKAIHEKLIRLVGQLHESEKRRLQMEQLIVDLLEAASAFQKANALDRAQKRAEYEVVVRNAREFLAGNPLGAIRPAETLDQGRVLHLEPELDSIVINLGKKLGARIGMPFKILQGDQVIAKCRIVEARDYLSAALVEGVVKNKKVQVGDRLLVDAIK